MLVTDRAVHTKYTELRCVPRYGWRILHRRLWLSAGAVLDVLLALSGGLGAT